MVSNLKGIRIGHSRDHASRQRGGVLDDIDISPRHAATINDIVACTAREALSKARSKESIIKRCAADALAIGRDGRINVHIGNAASEAVLIGSRIVDHRTDIERVAHS